MKNDGREYIDGIKTYRINSGNYFYSTYGQGAIVTINTHKCYLKISPNESIEMFDFDDKKYTFSYIKEIFAGFDIKSHKNALLRTNTVNTFIYAFINSDNYVAMIKFKIISNNANNSIQIIKILKEDFKTIPTDTRTCMITKNQYIECLDIDENQMYVIRIYNIDLKFLKQYELEKNNSPLERAIASYHETVWLKDEISIFVYYNDTKENGAKPIMVLKKLTVKSSQVTLSNLNNYLIRDTFFKNMQYQFSDTENSLAIFNAYYFGITSLAYLDNNSQYLIVALANIFNDDKTIDTHYFNIPLTDFYDINYQSGLRAFGYKNAYGVQMNYLHKNIPTSGFIIFGYGNTTDPDPINNLFDKYDSYTIKVKDFYQGIDNNLFCYVFVDIEVTRIPSSTYFSMKTASGKTIKKGSKINLNDEIIITKIKGKTPPVGRYVLGLSPYLNEADYDGFTKCSVDRDMFGEQVPTNWYPDEFYGRTIEFKFTVGIDCFVNCLTCNEKGTNVNDQKCSLCKDGYYFLDNTNNCFGEIPEGYYFNETKKIYMKCFDSCKACSKMKEGNNHNCKVCKDNYIMFQNTNCFNCKLENNYLNYEQTECVDKLPDGYYINDTEYNTIDKCYEKCKTCKEGSLSEKNMKCLSCYNDKGFYLKEGSNNCLSEIKEGEYLDNDNKIIKKCNIACKTCYAKEIINDKGDVINCDSCNTNEGFYLIDGTTICTNKTLEKSTEIISKEQKETIITKKCHKNCLDCSDFSLNDQEMKCLTCDNIKGFYLLEGTTNCIQNPYPGYYLKENELKKCYEKCLTCSEGPIFSEKGLIINMNCDSCNEKQGLQLIQGTKNCEIVINDNYTFIYGCPRDKPILKNKKCVLEYCTEEQYENAECIISNPIIEKQWISEYPSFSNEKVTLLLNKTYQESPLVKHNDLIMPFETTDFLWSSDNPTVASVDRTGKIIAKSKGSANITASISSLSTKYTVVVVENESEIEHEYVDLGLSVSWASFNVGSITEEDFGDYFAWGETEIKDDYSWSTYKYSNGNSFSLTKYNWSVNNGTVDNKSILDIDDDVAQSKWGGYWRMPTEDDLQELINNCDWEWITINGINGYKISSKISGFENSHIFLPVAGDKSGTSIYSENSDGGYWSSTLYTNGSDGAKGLQIDSNSRGIYVFSRHTGYSVRPVCHSEAWLASTTIELSESTRTIIPNKTFNLNATVKHNGATIGAVIRWSSDNPSVATVDDKGKIYTWDKGIAHIKASYSSLFEECTVVVGEESDIVHEYVHLGLSVKWATYNVGAISEEELGDYYSWGDVKTRRTSMASYIWCKGDEYSYTKYCNNSDYGYNGFVDNKTVLDEEDDAAHVLWGGDWRMPSGDEFKELVDNCTWKWTTINNVKGYSITSNIEGYTDESIFFPCTGYVFGDLLFNSNEGHYWARTIDTEKYIKGLGAPEHLYFSIESHSAGWNSYRYQGAAIRPVCP